MYEHIDTHYYDIISASYFKGLASAKAIWPPNPRGFLRFMEFLGDGRM